MYVMTGVGQLSYHRSYFNLLFFS